MADCLFCRIAAKELEGDIVYESEDVIAFRDINPAAPTHFLVIPKEHIESAAELGESHTGVLAEMFEAMVSLASQEGLTGGYRIVTNIGADGGQTVPHLHFHVLGGRGLSWPPG